MSRFCQTLTQGASSILSDTVHSDSSRKHSAAAWLACLILGAALYSGVTLCAQAPQPGTAPPAPAAARCRVEGRVTSASGPLPGASVVVHVGDALKAATSTDIDGKYRSSSRPSGTYHLTVELTAFSRVERDVTLPAAPCDTTIDFALTLRPRGEPLSRRRPRRRRQRRPRRRQLNRRAARQEMRRRPHPRKRRLHLTPRLRRAAAPAADGRGGQAAQGAQAAAAGRGARGFEQLNVQSDATGAATLDAAGPEDPNDVARLLPQGFSLDAAQSSAVAITDSGDATSLDRGALNDRQQAIGLGQFDPSTGQFATGFGPDAAQGPGGNAGAGGGGRGGPGGPGGRGGGPGGRGGPGGFNLGGRGARGQSPYQGTIITRSADRC